MMGSDQYCLKWNNHWANLVRVFNSLRQSETFVDVTLACEGRHLKAHRLVLSACSPYFKELLVSHPDKHPIVILKDVRFSELQSLIQFIYNGEVSVDQQDLASLLDTAKELQIRGLADNHHASNSLPSSRVMAAKANNIEWSALKDSTKSSSNLFPTKPNDEPTNLTVRNDLPLNNGIATSYSTSSTHDHPSPRPSSSPSLSPPRNVPHSSSLPQTSDDRPLPTSAKNCAKSPEEVVPEVHTNDSSSRGGSPLFKRRKLASPADLQTDVSEIVHSVIPDEVIRMKLMSDIQIPKTVAGTSSTETSVIKNDFQSVNGDFGHEKENLEPELDVLKQPKDKPPDKDVPEEESDEDDGPMSIQPPEVILEEDEDDDDVGVITTNGTSSPSLFRSTSTSSSLSEAPISSTTPLPMSPQVSFLQQALAMGFQQPLHFLQHPSPEQNHQQKLQGGSHPSPMNPSGFVQAKNILNFVDLLKAMGASIPPGSQSGLISNSNAKISGSAHSHSGSVSPISSISGARDSDRNPLTCHICARIMPSLQVLEEHVRIHEEEKPYKCEQCGQRYKYQSAFQRHQEQNHTAKLPGDKPYRCDVCGQCFKYHKSFTKHRANHDLLDNFLKVEHGEDGKGAIRALQESYLQRLLHSSTFPHGEGLLTSIKEEINDPADQDLSKEAKSPLVTSTSVPGMLGPENGEIKEEEDDDIDIDEIVPDVPGEGEEDFEDSNSGRFFYCIQCKLTFRDLKGFEGHCRLSPECSSDTLKEVSVGGDISVTSIPSSEATLSKVSSTPQASPSTSLCGGTSTTATSLNNSNLVFSSPPGMLYTLVSGMPQSSCFPNMSTNPTILNLSKFVNINNIPNLPSCIRPHESLNYAAAAAAGNLSTMNSVNSLLAGMEEERPFKCPYCQKGFKGRENLKLHIRTHTGEKPYNCGVCGKAFGGRSDMNRHLRIHTGEKPYPCKVCGKKFARADYLSKHITTHLGIPFAKPVHSLQQSLQNLENMQNLQNFENMQNLHSANLLSSLPSLQNLQSVAGLHSLQQSFPNLQSLQQSVQHLQNLQSASNAVPQQTSRSVGTNNLTNSVTGTSLLMANNLTDSVTGTSLLMANNLTANNKEEIPNLSK